MEEATCDAKALQGLKCTMWDLRLISLHELYVNIMHEILLNKP